MKSIVTIFRRDLAAYFTSPVGYIYMMVFLLISVGLFITSFFTFPVADMRGYFANLPILLCVFMPAVTMRVWAEERKENTWEMLLTFPMRSWELAAGKFLATFTFFALTLAGSITIPVMLVALGNPDLGPIIGGYVGTLLLGAFFLAIGIFFSALCKDQIVAFVVTLLACFALFLAGTTFIASYIDDAMPGLGSLLMDVLGVLGHYSAFTRGVIEVGDVVYFFAWTAIFLLLNVFYTEGRSRPGFRFTYGGAVALCLGIGLMINWLLTGQSLGRFDLTEDRIYTVSDASTRILGKLDTPVQVKLYITPRAKMPTGLQRLEQDISAKIEELAVAAKGKVRFETVYLEAANVLAQSLEDEEKEAEEADEAKSIERRMLEKGLTPFGVRATSEDQVTQQFIYSHVGIAYKAEQEEIIPQVMPESVPELEYRLVNSIYKLTRKDPPKVAMVAPKEAVNIPPHLRQLYMQMGQPIPQTDDPYELLEAILRQEKYEVSRVDLSQESPLPEEYDTLVVVNPRQLSDRQRWEINRALVSGKSVFLAVQNEEWRYEPTQDGRLNVTRQAEDPEINPLLEKYGLAVDTDILMDANHVPLTIQTSADPLAALLGGGTVIRLPIQMMINPSSMDSETSITQRLEAIFYLWGSAIQMKEEELKKYGLEARVLMNTSPQAWKVPSAPRLMPPDVAKPAETKQYPIMAMVSGQFPDAHKGEPRPAWPPAQPMPGMPPPPPPEEDAEVAPVEPAPAKLLLMGCSEMFRKNFLQAGNLDLFLNGVDAITLGDELVNVRGRKPIDRTIDLPSAVVRGWWKVINYALVNVIIAVTGIAVAATRRRARNLYAAKFATREL